MTVRLRSMLHTTLDHVLQHPSVFGGAHECSQADVRRKDFWRQNAKTRAVSWLTNSRQRVISWLGIVVSCGGANYPTFFRT